MHCMIRDSVVRRMIHDEVISNDETGRDRIELWALRRTDRQGCRGVRRGVIIW